MTGQPQRPLLLLFVDGLGLAPANPDNPLSRLALPSIELLLGGPAVKETLDISPSTDGSSRRATLSAIDACLGVEGLPQSATGQATLFTGRNAAQAIGRHVPALPGAKLRSLIEEHSIFRTLTRRGLSCAFANAFTERFFEYLSQPRQRRRPSASLSAALAGNVRLRNEQDLLAGNAVAWDITREYFGVPLPHLRKRADQQATEKVGPVTQAIDARSAGLHLAQLARQHDFTLFETFVTDLAGHGRYVIDSRSALERVDGLIGGLLSTSSAPDSEMSELTVVVTSDHGNVEDETTRLHTRNPVPLISWGPGAAEFTSARSLVDVTPAIVRWLES